MKDHTDRTFSVYLLTCIPTGSRYVGITLLPLPQRWRQHVSLAMRNGRTGALQKAILDHGEAAFDMKAMRSVVGLDAACNAEREEIARLGTLWPDGMNMNEGGGVRAGFRHSQETIRKMREAAAGRVIKESTKAKLAEAARAQWSDPCRRQKIMEGREADHVKAAQRESGKRLVKQYPAAAKGLVHTQETREKIGKAGRGRAAWNKGKPMLPHVMEALIQSHAGKPGHRRGTTHTPEARARMSASQRKRISPTRQVLLLLAGLDNAVHPRGNEAGVQTWPR